MKQILHTATLLSVLLAVVTLHSALLAQDMSFLQKNVLKDELTAFKVIRSEQIEKSGVLVVSEILRRYAPQVKPQTSMGTANFVLYFDGIKTEPEFIDETDVQRINRIVIWRGNWAPIYYRTTADKFVVLIEKKDER